MTFGPDFKERMKAYTKVAGFLRPTKYVWRPFGGLLELDRCDSDGCLVTNSPGSLSDHLGHRMRQPVKLSLWEVFLVWIRVIR